MTNPATPYSVERIEEIPLPDPTGRITWVTRVHYTLPNGYRGEVTIPKRQPTAEEVKALLDADAARVAQIYGL